MHRPHTTFRLLLALLLVLALGGVAVFNLRRHASDATDIFSFQGVRVCATDRDFQAGKHRCPGAEDFVVGCEQAKAAVAAVPGVVLLSAAGQAAESSLEECELRTVSAEKKLYSLLVHAYYSPSSLSSDGIDTLRSQAISTLYDAYANFYQPHITPDYPIPSSQIGVLQPFIPAFLVTGEPGFRVTVAAIDETGASKPGAGTLVRMSCGNAQDTMVAEPDGNSWFSFAGYEKLECGQQPLKAEVMVQKDGLGQWITDTPSYSYAYEPAAPVVLAFQNRPQPAAVSFLGRWQGIGVTVTTQSPSPDGSSQSAPLPKAGVAFACSERLASPLLSGSAPVLERTTDAQGQARISLADAQHALLGCAADKFVASLSAFDPRTGSWKQDDPSYAFYFANPGPVAAGTVSGPDLGGGEISGQELAVAGRVGLADVGSVPGGFLTGSLVCLFYTPEAAKAVDGCPPERSLASVSVRADGQGYYRFGGSPAARISYGQYAKDPGKAVVRIVNFQNQAYAEGVVEQNNATLKAGELNLKNITLPSDQDALKDHVCLAVQRTWGDQEPCDPLLRIVDLESRWDVGATNPSSGACGLFQSNPCSKYQETALSGENYKAIGNQIRWGVQYVKGRYGTPKDAWSFWQANGHY